MRYEELTIEGRNAVLEAFRAGKTIDKLFVLDGCQDGPVRTILREAKKTDCIVNFVKKERLDQMSETGKHQGVIAYAAAYEYGTVEEMLERAKEKNEQPFLILLDNIEDPHNLGAIVRTAECVGAHGVIVPKRRASGLTLAVEKSSAGALEHMLVAKVNNISSAIDELKDKGLWIYGADMLGKNWTSEDLTGAVGIVIGSEGRGISENVRKKCDFILSLPMKGKVNSLNASVAAGVLMYEVCRQRL